MRTTSALAMSVVLGAVACSSGGGGGGDGGASTASASSPSQGATSTPANGSIERDLVGQWYAGRGGTMISYDTSTGQLGQASGSGMLFVFKGDGTYVKAVQSIEDGPCLLGYVTTESGVVNESDSTISLHPTHGNMHTYSCGAGKDQPLEVHDDVLTWSLAPYSVDPSIPGLTLTNQTGATAEFRKTQ